MPILGEVGVMTHPCLVSVGKCTATPRRCQNRLCRWGAHLAGTLNQTKGINRSTCHRRKEKHTDDIKRLQWKRGGSPFGSLLP